MMRAAAMTCQHAGVVTDVVLLSKGLSGGIVPVGAMVVRDAVWEPLFRNRHCFIHASPLVRTITPWPPAWPRCA